MSAIIFIRSARTQGNIFFIRIITKGQVLLQLFNGKWMKSIKPDLSPNYLRPLEENIFLKFI